MSSYGKLTIKGSDQFEKKLSSFLDNIRHDIEYLVDKEFYEAIILIGGYGRGEGGVININGVEQPHNNFDFLVISKKINSDQTSFLHETCKEVFENHASKLGVLVEFTIMEASKLKNIDPLVITYDMKYGHKLISGNSDILTKNKNFEVDTIPSWDVRNLIVNRGTLLIINDLILNKKKLDKKDRKNVIKHWVKAIIGYGDALLFYMGEYHYSYVEKQKRMKKQTNVNIKFRALYNSAMNFRFSPNYERYDELNIYKFQAYIKQELFKIHERCEELALDNTKLNSNVYINKAIESSLNDNNSIKATLKKFYYLTKSTPSLNNFSLIENIKYKMLGMKGMMPILFPYIAYGINNEYINSILTDFFQTKNKDDCLKNQYLSYWKLHVNDNFVREDFGI